MQLLHSSEQEQRGAARGAHQPATGGADIEDYLYEYRRIRYTHGRQEWDRREFLDAVGLWMWDMDFPGAYHLPPGRTSYLSFRWAEPIVLGSNTATLHIVTTAPPDRWIVRIFLEGAIIGV